MNTNQITKNRNNGKSRNYYNHKQKKIIITDNDNQGKPQTRDQSLFNMARTLGVEINRRQRIRWFLNIHDHTDDNYLKQKIEKICCKYGFIGNRVITIGQVGKKNRLVIDAPLFLFTRDNIVQVSNDLLEFAIANSMFYEGWEVVPPQTTILSRIKKLFN